MKKQVTLSSINRAEVLRYLGYKGIGADETIWKGVAETAEHDNQPAGEVHLDKHPNGQPDTRQ